MLNGSGCLKEARLEPNLTIWASLYPLADTTLTNKFTHPSTATELEDVSILALDACSTLGNPAQGLLCPIATEEFSKQFCQVSSAFEIYFTWLEPPEKQSHPTVSNMLIKGFVLQRISDFPSKFCFATEATDNTSL
jgi:hypothetical protein